MVKNENDLRCIWSDITILIMVMVHHVCHEHGVHYAKAEVLRVVQQDRLTK